MPEELGMPNFIQQLLSAEIARLKEDVARFEWVLPIIDAEGELGDRRTVLVGKQFMRGLAGRAAIDAAIAEEVNECRKN